MARNGSGTYNLPTPQNPVVGSTLISSANHNTTMLDVAAALSASIANDGQTTIYADIPFNTHKITGLAPGSISTDAANVSQITSALNFTQTGTGASTRTVQNRIAETISVKDYGAFGDGTSHPLIDRFATLALAQAVYPHATALTDESDWAATQAAVNYATTKSGSGGLIATTGIGIYFPDGIYLFNQTVTVLNIDGLGLYSSPSKGALLVATLASQVLFSVGNAVDDGLSTYRTVFENLAFSATVLTATATFAIKLNRAPNTIINNCMFFNFYVALDGYAWTQSSILNCIFYNLTRATNAALASIRLQGLDWSSTGQYYTPGGGLHITSCEFIGNNTTPSLMTNNLLVHSVDGLYVNSCHFMGAINSVNIAPQGNAANNIITDIFFGGACYFDHGHNSGARNVIIGGTANYVDANRPGVYQNIHFTDTIFGGSAEVDYNCLISIVDGGAWITNNRKIHNITFSDSTLQYSKQNGITILGTSSSKLEVYNVSIDHCNFNRFNVAGTETYSAIIAECEQISITNNQFEPDSVAASYNIQCTMSLAASNAPSFICQGNDFSRSNCTVSPINYTDLIGAYTNISDNIYPGKGQEVDQLVKATTTDASPKILWSRDVGSSGQIGFVRTRTVGGNSNCQERSRYENKAHYYRDNTGNVVISTTEVSGNQVITNNDKSVILDTLTGSAFIASHAYVGGDLVTNAGHVYLVIDGGTSGGTGPTHTSGAVANGTTLMGFVANTAVNTIALFVAGTAATTMYWAADVEFMCVP